MTAETASTRTRAPGRPREFEMDEALDKAAQIFCERGFHATSINELAEAMELTAGSIYKAFKDKRAVFLAALDRQMATRGAALRVALDGAGDGRAKVRAALDLYARVSHGSEGRIGCLVVGTAMELTTFDAEIAERVRGALQKRQELLAGLIAQGQTDGSIPAAIDTAATARLLLCVLQGMRVLGKTSPEPDAMLSVAEVAMKLLD